MSNLWIWFVVILSTVGTILSQGAEQPLTAVAGKESPKELTVDLGGGVKLEMVLVPAGEFMMGDKENKPAHKVKITRPFYLGKYEVTQKQWEAVMGNNPSRFKGARNPVEQVSWDDCQKFIETLNAKAGLQAGRFALPTEAQWEYASRGGRETRYCYGDEKPGLVEYGWFSDNSGSRTQPVGGRKPNDWGLFDMHGNVSEWCQDWFGGDYYANSPEDNPAGPEAGTSRVVRGGFWGGSAWACRSPFRDYNSVSRLGHHLGCRVSLVLAE
ncbi:MAG: formylglycine-generating enzyme family protein [Verrucomicrobiales bacterium]